MKIVVQQYLQAETVTATPQLTCHHKILIENRHKTSLSNAVKRHGHKKIF
jgi:hypothetical protein